MRDEADEAVASVREAHRLEALKTTSASCARGEHGMCQGHFARTFNQGHGQPLAIQCTCACHPKAA